MQINTPQTRHYLIILLQAGLLALSGHNGDSLGEIKAGMDKISARVEKVEHSLGLDPDDNKKRKEVKQLWQKQEQ